MRKIKAALAVLLSAGILLSGCAGRGASSTFSPKESGIYVDRDGGIQSATVKAYEVKDYHSVEKMNAFAQSAVDEYNGAAGVQDAVTLVSGTMEDGVACLIFQYKSGGDLVKFAREYEDTANQVASLETASPSELAGVAEASFIKVKDKSAVDGVAVAAEDGLRAVAVEGTASIQTAGKIIYATEGVTLSDNFTARTPEGKSYIIFK